MLALFSNTYQSRGQISQHPQTRWYKDRIIENVQRQQEYYAPASRAVFADHPLAQLLKLIGANARVDDFDLYSRATIRAPYIGTTLGFTSETNRGKLQGHSVYGSENNLILNVYGYQSPYDLVANWRQVTPVQCVWRDRNYVDMAVPDNRTSGEMLDCLAVDIPSLVMKYRGFIDYRKKVMDSTTSAMVLGEENFIAMYVLPSILNSQVDVTVASAVQSVFYGKFQKNARVDSPIYLSGYSNEFESIARYALARIEGSKMQYIHMLQHIPSIYRDTAAQSLILPDLAPTTQIQWALLVSRLKTILFLIDVGGKAAIDTNRGYINDIKKKTREISITGIPFLIMSDELKAYVSDAIVRIQRL